MDSSKRTQEICRFIVCFLFFSFILTNTVFEFGVTQDQPKCIEDKAHIVLKDVNEFFRNNKNIKNTIFIASNAILDVSTIFMGILWLSFMKKSRILISIILFFVFKIFIQMTFLVRPPFDNLIEYPGFPSLFYSYKKNNFFFFSGTAGFTFILIYEFFSHGDKIKFSKFFGIINVINLIVFSFLCISTYSVYTMDILIGILTSHYTIRLSIYIHPLVDDMIFNNEIFRRDFYEILFNCLKTKYEILESLTTENIEDKLKVGKIIESQESDVPSTEKRIEKVNEIIINNHEINMS